MLCQAKQAPCLSLAVYDASNVDSSSDIYDLKVHKDDQNEDEAEDGLVPNSEDLDLIAIEDNGDTLRAAVHLMVRFQLHLIYLLNIE